MNQGWNVSKINMIYYLSILRDANYKGLVKQCRILNLKLRKPTKNSTQEDLIRE